MICFFQSQIANVCWIIEKARQRMRWLDDITVSVDLGVSKLGDGDGEVPAYCSPWVCKESDRTLQLNSTTWISRPRLAVTEEGIWSSVTCSTTVSPGDDWLRGGRYGDPENNLEKYIFSAVMTIVF